MSDDPANDPRAATMAEKLGAVIIPRVEFRGATLRQCLHFVWEKLRTMEGFNGFLARVDPALDYAAHLRVTASLRDIPAFELLRLISGTTAAKFRVEESGVSFSPIWRPNYEVPTHGAN